MKLSLKKILKELSWHGRFATEPSFSDKIKYPYDEDEFDLPEENDQEEEEDGQL